MASKVLRWMIGAGRSLHIAELCEAVGLSLLDHNWDASKFPPESLLLAAGGNLLAKDEHDLHVRLTHPSVKTFLCGGSQSLPNQYHIDAEKAALLCGEECIKYLDLGDFKMDLERRIEHRVVIPPLHGFAGPGVFQKAAKTFSRITSSGSSSTSAKKSVQFPVRMVQQVKNDETRFALLQYAREYWAPQTKSITETSALWPQFRSLALHANRCWKFHPWQTTDISPTSHMHGLLAYASRTRHLPLLRVLLSESASPRLELYCNIPFIRDGLPALHAASRLGYADVVSLLLEVCDVNTRDLTSNTALDHAVEKDHIEVAYLIVATGKVKRINMALQFAARHGSVEMTELILKVVPTSPILYLGRVEYEGLDEALLAASTGGHVPVLRLLISSTKSVSGSICGLCLHAAVLNVDPIVIGEIWKWVQDGRVKKVDAVKVEIGRVLLPLAACKGDGETVRALLLWKGIDVNHKQHHGAAPLFLAAERGHRGVVAALLQHKDLLVNCPGRYDQTALQIAAGNGHEAVVKMLLNRDDVLMETFNYETTFGVVEWRTLAMAVVGRCIAVVEALLSTGEGLDTSKHFALDLASSIGFEAMYRAIAPYCPLRLSESLSSGSSNSANLVIAKMFWGELWGGPFYDDTWTPLHLAAGLGCYPVVASLLEQGCTSTEVNARERHGFTPLNFAAFQRDEEVTRLLVNHGGIVDLNACDESGATALHIAAARGATTIMEQLFQAEENASAHAKSQYGLTPLHLAAHNGQEEVVRILLHRSKRDYLNAKDNYGNTPLHLAALNGQYYVVKQLLCVPGVMVHPRNEGDETPLHLAADGEDAGVIMALVQESNSEDLNAVDHAGCTPLHRAVARGHGDIVKFLLFYCDDLKMEALNNSSQSAKDLALANGHMEIAKAIRQRIDREPRSIGKEGE